MSASSFKGICCPAGVATRMLPICHGIVAILPLQPNDEIKLFFLLDDLCGDIAADRGLDQAVNVVDVDSVASNRGPIDLIMRLGCPSS